VDSLTIKVKELHAQRARKIGEYQEKNNQLAERIVSMEKSIAMIKSEKSSFLLKEGESAELIPNLYSLGIREILEQFCGL